MITFKKKIAIFIGLSIFYSSQFTAIASNHKRERDNASDELAKSPADIPVVVTSAGTEQTEFLPLVRVPDMKKRLAGLMCEIASPSHLAQVCRSWHKFILDREFRLKAKDEWQAIPFLANTLFAQQCMMRFWSRRDAEIMNSGIFCYLRDGNNAMRIELPDGARTLDVKLSTMGETNGDLVLPDVLAQLPLCITRNVETFVNPVGDNRNKLLLLLLTLTELKDAARQISTDAPFLGYAALASLSDRAACLLLREGAYDLANNGFVYSIVKYSDKNGLPLLKWMDINPERVRVLELNKSFKQFDGLSLRVLEHTVSFVFPSLTRTNHTDTKPK